MKCSKCGSLPKESDQLAWRCNSCKKVYRVSLKNIRGFAEKKQGGITKPLLKCKECGAPLDDGNETIAWKCSCGNVQKGKLGDYKEEFNWNPNEDRVADKEEKREVPLNNILKIGILVAVGIVVLIAIIFFGKPIFNKKAENEYSKNDYEPTQNEIVEDDYNDLLIEEEKEEEPETDAETIMLWYDAIGTIYNSIENESYDSLESLISDNKEPILSLADYDKNGSEYEVYIDDIQNDSTFKKFVSDYILNESDLDLDSEYTQRGHAQIVSVYIEHLLQIELPFEYSIQDDFVSSIADGKAENVYYKYIAYIDKEIENGVNVNTKSAEDVWQFGYDKTSIYSINGKDVGFWLNFNLERQDRYQEFNVYFNLPRDGESVVNSCIFSDGVANIVYNSVNIQNIVFFQEVMSFTQIYNSEYKDSMNEKYYELEKMVYSGKNIKVTLDDRVTLELNDHDMNSLRAYFIMFDVMRAMVATKQAEI